VKMFQAETSAATAGKPCSLSNQLQIREYAKSSAPGRTRSSSCQEHEAAGFRAGKRQRLVNKLVDQEALARIIGAGLGEILVTKLHLNLAKLFLVVKRARPGRPIFT
jgi:hypothetical protein